MNNKQKTHLKTNTKLNGEPIELKEGYSKVKLTTTPDMVVDDKGLVHGGFAFSLADFAAMIAVNHPNVVLGGADVKFIAPVKEGDVLIAEANVTDSNGKKQIVDVNVKRENDVVFEGQFICFCLDEHVLD